MLIVITVAAILGIIAAVIFYNVFDSEFGSAFLAVICIVALIACIVGFCVCGSRLVSGKYIDEKIVMYQEENTKIEQQVAESINAYLEHESKVFENASNKVNPESAITIIAAYPELNSSELITKQIEIYNNNNAEIKRLKAAKIDLAVHKWWLYFGS